MTQPGASAIGGSVESTNCIKIESAVDEEGLFCFLHNRIRTYIQLPVKETPSRPGRNLTQITGTVQAVRLSW